VAELVDALVSGTSGESREGSSPFLGTMLGLVEVLIRPKSPSNQRITSEEVQHGAEPFACVQHLCWYIRWYAAQSPRGDTKMALTDFAIKRALSGTKIIKLSDGGGLQLWITPDGAKRWRIAYRFRGVQKTLAVGVYPEVGLKVARDAREGDTRLRVRLSPAAGQDAATKRLS
jgi:hypothetical protein